MYQGRYATQNAAGRFTYGYMLFFARTANKAVLFVYEGEEVDDVGARDPTIASVHYPIGLVDRKPDLCESNRIILNLHSSASTIGIAVLSLVLMVVILI